jgi:hypothetical protein
MEVRIIQRLSGFYLLLRLQEVVLSSLVVHGIPQFDKENGGCHPILHVMRAPIVVDGIESAETIFRSAWEMVCTPLIMRCPFRLLAIKCSSNCPFPLFSVFYLKHLQKPVESTAEKIIFNIDQLIQVRNNFNYRIRLYLLAKLILSAHARDYKVQLLERMLNCSCWQQDDVLIRVYHCPSLSQTFGGTGPTATLMFRISFHTYFVSLKALLFLFFVPELQCL